MKPLRQVRFKTSKVKVKRRLQSFQLGGVSENVPKSTTLRSLAVDLNLKSTLEHPEISILVYEGDR